MSDFRQIGLPCVEAGNTDGGNVRLVQPKPTTFDDVIDSIDSLTEDEATRLRAGAPVSVQVAVCATIDGLKAAGYGWRDKVNSFEDGAFILQFYPPTALDRDTRPIEVIISII